MKKYIDIQVVRERETVLDDITLPVNTGAFQVGDIISITEKMDGANASIRYDEKEDVLRAFSRNNELSKDQNLMRILGIRSENGQGTICNVSTVHIFRRVACETYGDI